MNLVCVVSLFSVVECMSTFFFLILVNFSHVCEWSLAKQIEDDNALVSREPFFSFMQKIDCFAVVGVLDLYELFSIAPSHNSIMLFFFHFINFIRRNGCVISNLIFRS